eukprot:scaffold996_cov101-Isochrysis_galbana.AAC.2
MSRTNSLSSGATRSREADACPRPGGSGSANDGPAEKRGIAGELSSPCCPRRCSRPEVIPACAALPPPQVTSRSNAEESQSASPSSSAPPPRAEDFPPPPLPSASNWSGLCNGCEDDSGDAAKPVPFLGGSPVLPQPALGWWTWRRLGECDDSESLLPLRGDASRAASSLARGALCGVLCGVADGPLCERKASSWFAAVSSFWCR